MQAEKVKEMNKDFKVIITGFSSLAEAEEFVSWYSEQGEQDSTIWFDCRKEEGLIEHSSMYYKSSSTKGNSVTMELELHE